MSINLAKISSFLSNKQARINPNSLGWIRSDGVISFRDNSKAMEYAKNMCLKALHSNTPFERGVVVKDNLILAVSNGTSKNANLHELKVIQDRIVNDVSPDLTLVHGHPDMFGKGKTTPLSDLSLGDLACLVKFKLKSIIAINSKGEFNSATRTANFTKEKFTEAEKLFDNLLAQKLGIDKLIKNYQSLTEQIRKTKDTIQLSKLKRMRSEIIDKIGNLDRTKSNDYAQAVHETYKECLQNAGIEYKTNFSNLT